MPKEERMHMQKEREQMPRRKQCYVPVASASPTRSSQYLHTYITLFPDVVSSIIMNNDPGFVSLRDRLHQQPLQAAELGHERCV